MADHPTSRKRTRCIPGGFAAEAERIFSLPIDDRTSRLGGYGPGGE
ncbi:MAG: hypothetical protein K8T91_16145 [Planctomycetes bacterium]|nr:hypothetical protein [Planctomycetota bacterium]